MHCFCTGFVYLCSGLIQKVMAKNLLNKYVWLVETIYKAKKISFEEINQRWLDNDLSEDKPLSIRTFHKWRQSIEEMFGLLIENENSGQYRYYILNADELKNGSMRSWLFNTLTVSNLMLDSVSIKDKILFEEIPDGEQFLPMILEALKKNQVLEMIPMSFSTILRTSRQKTISTIALVSSQIRTMMWRPSSLKYLQVRPIIFAA